MRHSLFFCAFFYTATALAGSFHLEENSFNQLPGWNSDHQRDTLVAFRESCRIFLNSPHNTLDSHPMPLDKKKWLSICKQALTLNSVNDATARAFFQNNFRPMIVHRNNHDSNGLFTGYYLPTVAARHHREGKFTAPLYTRPDDLVSVNLGNFNPAWTGKSLTGRVIGNELKPYNAPRAAINNGALKGHAKVIAWVTPIDQFFLQVQGSGAVQFENGRTMLLGFSGKNGSGYKSIGRVLVDRGVFTLENVSMQNIRRWMEKHPHQAESLMNQNASFVFFKPLNSKAPFGTQNTPLTAERSLAVDYRLIPLGLPVWLDTAVPNAKNPQQLQQWRHLLVTQDTGGAIRGPIRGDVYWGSGDKAEYIAGNMKSPGRYWLLLPRHG